MEGKTLDEKILCQDSAVIIISKDTSTMDAINSAPAEKINITDLPSDSLQATMSFLCSRDQDALAESHPNLGEVLTERYGPLASSPTNVLKLMSTFMEANDQRSFCLTCKRCQEAVDEAIIAPNIQMNGYCLLKQRVSTWKTIAPMRIDTIAAEVFFNRKKSSCFILKTSREGRSKDTIRLNVEKLLKSHANFHMLGFVRADAFIITGGQNFMNRAFIITAYRKNETGALVDVCNDMDTQRLIEKFLIDYGMISMKSNISFDGGNSFSSMSLHGSLDHLFNAGHIIQNPNGTISLTAQIAQYLPGP